MEGARTFMKVGLARGIVRTLRAVASERRAWLRHVRAVEGTIAWGAEIAVDPASELVLGPASSLGRGTVVALKPGAAGRGSLVVGRGTYIGEYNNLRAEGSAIRVGDMCLISQFVSLIANGHAYQERGRLIAEQGVSEKGGVTIGDDVWIGCNAVVLPGVQVGQGAVVAAGSVVVRDVEPYTIVAGSPARPVGERH